MLSVRINVRNVPEADMRKHREGLGTANSLGGDYTSLREQTRTERTLASRRRASALAWRPFSLFLEP